MVDRERDRLDDRLREQTLRDEADDQRNRGDGRHRPHDPVKALAGRFVACLLALDLERFERVDRLLVCGEQLGRRGALRVEEIERVVLIELRERLREDAIEQRAATGLQCVEQRLLLGVARMQPRIREQFVVALLQQRAKLRDLVLRGPAGADDLRDVGHPFAQHEHALGAGLQVQQRRGVVAVHRFERVVAEVQAADARGDHEDEQQRIAGDGRDEPAADRESFSHVVPLPAAARGRWRRSVPGRRDERRMQRAAPGLRTR
ncbi:hypothetical protein FEP65_03893 [Burkholderia multivorans]|nr:hypothetical protein [Burkholderia multivorans]